MHQGGHGERGTSQWRVVPSQGKRAATWRVRCLRDGATRRCGPGTHSNERKGAVRGDCDANRVAELGAGADAVAGTVHASAGDRGGRPGGDVDTADPVVGIVLRCIIGST